MINSIVLQGRLCGDPEMRQTETGVSVCRFQLAIERNYKAKDGAKLADFIPVTAWRQTADFISHWFHKGDMIMLRGRLESRSYEKDGQKRTAYEVNADEVAFAANAKPVQTTPPAEPAEVQAEMALPENRSYADDGFPY
jgi:single-strand DNA-binding protein